MSKKTLSTNTNLLFFFSFFILLSSFGSDRTLQKDKESFPYPSTDKSIIIESKKNEPQADQPLVFSVRTVDGDGTATLIPSPSKQEADSIIHSLQVSIRSPFEQSRAPYAGHISDVIVCKTKKYLKNQSYVFRGSKTEALLAVANDRLVVGSCDQDQMKNASLFWAGYDELRQQIIVVKLFKPLKNAQSVTDAQNELIEILKKIIPLG